VIRSRTLAKNSSVSRRSRALRVNASGSVRDAGCSVPCPAPDSGCNPRRSSGLARLRLKRRRATGSEAWADRNLDVSGALSQSHLRRRGIWTTDTGISVLVISSTVYNEIPGEPTVLVVPVFDTEPDTGFGVDLGENDWAAPGLVTSLRKARLSGHRRRIDVQALTDVNNTLFKILGTPDR
jgi:hypothetical protein